MKFARILFLRTPQKICSQHSTICLNGLQIRLKYISILSKYCDICSNSFCICLQTRSVSTENCTIHLNSYKYISILSKYCDICLNSFCICLQTRSVSAENCTIHSNSLTSLLFICSKGENALIVSQQQLKHYSPNPCD